MSRRIVLTLSILAALVVSGVAAGAAQAQDPYSTANSFQPWYPHPNSPGSYNFYRSNITPLSSVNTPEILDFGCNYPATMTNATGQVVPNNRAGLPVRGTVLIWLTEFFKAARNEYEMAYDGNSESIYLTENSKGGPDIAGGLLLALTKQAKMGGPVEITGEEDYWKSITVPITVPITIPNVPSAVLPSVNWNPTVGIGKEEGVVRIPVPPEAIPLITVTRHPGHLASAVPLGCELGELNELPWRNLKFSTLIQDTPTWLGNAILYAPGELTVTAYKFLEPWAFAYTFWTPHSERGDLMFFGANFSCKGMPTRYQEKSTIDGKEVPAHDAPLSVHEQAAYKEAQEDTCYGATPLGFSKQNLQNAQDSKAEAPVWVRMSMFFQWLLGATYFLIIAGGAVIYMSRANHRSSYTIVQMMPRLLLSIGVTVLLNFLIGGMITISNTLVQALFSLQDFASIRAIREIFGNFGNLDTNAISALGATLITIILMAAAVYYMLRFFIFAIWRQLALLALIVLSPLAAFTLIHPSWHHQFGRWLRALVALLAAPFVMALILKLGLAINPAVASYQNNGAGRGFLGDVSVALIGGLLLLVTFHMMARVPKLAKAVVWGRPLGTGFAARFGKAAQTAGGVAAFVPGVGTAAAAALYAGGTMAKGAGQRSDSINQGMAALIPDQKTRSTLRAPAGKPSLFQRLRDNDAVGSAAGSAGVRALESGSKSFDAADRARSEVGGAKGALTAGAQAGKGGMAMAAGAALLSAFHGNEGMKKHFSAFSKKRHAEQGVKPVPVSLAIRILDKSNQELAKAKHEAESQGRDFNADVWWHRVAWAPKSRGGLGLPRLYKRGRGAAEEWFVAEDWSPHARRPMTGFRSRVAPPPPSAPSPAAADVPGHYPQAPEPRPQETHRRWNVGPSGAHVWDDDAEPSRRRDGAKKTGI